MTGRTRTLDLRAAAAALMADGPEAVTMDTVARRLGLAKPTLYRLASSRAELVQMCVDAEAERVLDHLHAAYARGLGEMPRERLAAGLLALLRHSEESPAGFALLFSGRYAEARPAVRRIEDRLRELIRREPATSVPAAAHPEMLAAALLGAAAAVARRRLEDGPDPDTGALVASLLGTEPIDGGLS